MLSVIALGALLSLVLPTGASGAPGDPTAGRVADILPGPASGNPQELFDAGGTLLFYADDGVHGNELWRSNGGKAAAAKKKKKCKKKKRK